MSFITSVPRRTQFSAPIESTLQTGLKTASFVLFDKLATLNESVIDRRIGDATPEWLPQHLATFLSAFGFAGL